MSRQSQPAANDAPAGLTEAIENVLSSFPDEGTDAAPHFRCANQIDQGLAAMILAVFVLGLCRLVSGVDHWLGLFYFVTAMGLIAAGTLQISRPRATTRLAV